MAEAAVVSKAMFELLYHCLLFFLLCVFCVGSLFVVWLLVPFCFNNHPKRDTLIFYSYVGSGPASTVQLKKYQEFQAPQKIFECLATQKFPPILSLDLKKIP